MPFWPKYPEIDKYPPVFNQEIHGCQFLFDSLRIGTIFIDFVNRKIIGTPAAMA